MRSAFGITLAIMLALTGLFYYVGYTPALVLKAVPTIMEKYFPGASLESLQIKNQLLEYPSKLKLFDIHGALRWKDEVYQFDIKQLDIIDFWETWKSRQQAKFKVTGLTISKKNFELKNANFNIALLVGDNSVKSGEGFFLAEDIQVTPYRISNAQARFQANHETIKISDFLTYAYGGKIKGEINLTLAPQSAQVASLEFSGMSSEQMKTINKSFFSQLVGEFNGTLRLNKINDQIQILALLADMPKGAVLAPALAEKIIGYMTDEEKRYALQTILKNQHALKLSKAEFRILNINQNLAGVTFTLDNKERNLHVQETVNIDIARILQKIVWKF